MKNNIADFMLVYEENTETGLQWLKEHESEVRSWILSMVELNALARTLFKSHVECNSRFHEHEALFDLLFEKSSIQLPEVSELLLFLQMYRFVAHKLFKIKANQLVPLFETYENFIALSKCDIEVAKSVYDHSPTISAFFQTYEHFKVLFDISCVISLEILGAAYIASLLSTSAEFIALVNHNPRNDVPYQLIEVSPALVAALFKTASEFIELTAPRKNFEVAITLFKNAPQQIISLFQNYDEFLGVVAGSSGLAVRMIEKAPNKIADFFVTHTQFVELVNKDLKSAERLFDKCPEKISALFDNECLQQAMSTKAHLRPLFQKVSSYINKAQAVAKLPKIVESPQSESILREEAKISIGIGGESKSNPQTILKYFSVEKITPLAPESPKIKTSSRHDESSMNQSDKDHQNEPSTIAQTTPYFFYLKCLAGIAAVSAMLLLVAMQPVVGSVLIGVGLVAYGLFSLANKHKERQHAELEIALVKQTVSA